uniref:Succinate dehydrogenase assembly factor 3 n=2 Tax=Arion vulgaris TaxID=1028688 RepID=A0A0B7A3T3_9EUPU
MSSNISHVARIRALYKAILKLHKGLPFEMQSLGDNYVKEEFRAHKTAKPEETEIFVHEWTKYYVTLAKQLGQRKQKQEIGVHMSPEMLDNFRDEQLGQLHELFKVTVKTE